MILSKNPHKNEWEVTNKNASPHQTWADGIVTQNGDFSCNCEQFRKYKKVITECTHIKQVKAAVAHTEA